jgi:hypothetical protein
MPRLTPTLARPPDRTEQASSRTAPERISQSLLLNSLLRTLPDSAYSCHIWRMGINPRKVPPFHRSARSGQIGAVGGAPGRMGGNEE